MSLFNKRTGNFGEKAAVDYLLKNGFKILDKNFHTKLGEADIIASKDSKLHLIEVKTRSSEKYGQPYEAVSPLKIKRMENLLSLYLKKSPNKDLKLSLDVISIVLKGNNQIETLKFFENITS